MKGVIFTTFLNFLETELGTENSEKIITQATLNSGGAYTTVGFYDHKELMRLITLSSSELKLDAQQISQKFGNYLFHSLANKYPRHITGKSSCMDLFETINEVIHEEVNSIYPDAKPPEIRCERINSWAATLHYQSYRCLGDVMHGLIEGAGEYFSEQLQIVRKTIDQSGTQEVFTVIVQHKIKPHRGRKPT